MAKMTTATKRQALDLRVPAMEGFGPLGMASAERDLSVADRAMRGDVTGHDMDSLTHVEKVDYLKWLPLTEIRGWLFHDLTSEAQFRVLRTTAKRNETEHVIRAVVFQQIYPSIKVTVSWKDAFHYLRSARGSVEVLGVLWEGKDDTHFTWAKYWQYTPIPMNGDKGGLYYIGAGAYGDTRVLEEVTAQ